MSWRNSFLFFFFVNRSKEETINDSPGPEPAQVPLFILFILIAQIHSAVAMSDLHLEVASVKK